MADSRETSNTQAPVDPATQAFEALRGEVALLRRAMEGLAAEHRTLEIPDYSESLARITSMVSSVGKRLVALSELPALALSPEKFGDAISSASQAIRREDRETILIGRDALRETVAQLIQILQSARQADRQNKWLIWSGGGGAVAGILIWAFVFAPLFHKIGLALG